MIRDTVNPMPIHPGLLIAETPEQLKSLNYVWNASIVPADLDQFGIDS